MLTTVVTWLKNNKLLTLLSAYLIYISFIQGQLGSRQARFNSESSDSYSLGAPTTKMTPRSIVQEDMVQSTESSQRRVVTNSSLSMLVKSVRLTLDQIKQEAMTQGGYTVNQNINSPLENETGEVTVRIPLQNREAFLVIIKKLGVKILYENIDSYDITDQYTDIESRIRTLTMMNERFNDVLQKATDVDDMLRIQQKIFQVQDQLDRLQGQKDYLKQSSESTLITINLSTNELALPFKPDNLWDPRNVFKLATRSLVESGQKLGTLIIWVAVYSILWVPLLLIYKYLAKRLSNPKN